ncbi:hypothetical protein J6590_026318 [Homalodisca vitripennis]|nr:hypothetical protein J6590_026318 [Homalodisca vitripennis]
MEYWLVFSSSDLTTSIHEGSADLRMYTSRSAGKQTLTLHAAGNKALSSLQQFVTTCREKTTAEFRLLVTASRNCDTTYKRYNTAFRELIPSSSGGGRYCTYTNRAQKEEKKRVQTYPKAAWILFQALALQSSPKHKSRVRETQSHITPARMKGCTRDRERPPT